MRLNIIQNEESNELFMYFFFLFKPSLLGWLKGDVKHLIAFKAQLKPHIT